MLIDVQNASKSYLEISNSVSHRFLQWLAALFLLLAALSFASARLAAFIPVFLRQYGVQIFLAIALIDLFRSGWRPRLNWRKGIIASLIIVALYFGILKSVDIIIQLVRSMVVIPAKVPERSYQNFILTILLAPVFEELFFRDLMLRVFCSTFGRLWMAILISSALFMLGHMSFYPGAFLLGLITSVFFLTSQSAVPCIVFHFISNLSLYFLPVLFPNLHQALFDWNLLQSFYR